MVTAEIRHTIDARDMQCPRPLMSLIGAIHECEVGDLVEVEVHRLDKESRTDIATWLQKAGHELVEILDEDGFASFVIRKTR